MDIKILFGDAITLESQPGNQPSSCQLPSRHSLFMSALYPSTVSCEVLPPDFRMISRRSSTVCSN